MIATSSKDWIRTSPSNPCPICGRDDKDGDCRTNSDGKRVVCHYGKSLGPPQGLKKGDVLDGKDGQQWAFTGATNDGRGAHFKLDEPKNRTPHHAREAFQDAPSLRLARLPKPGKEPPDHWPNGKRLVYRFNEKGQPKLWVVVKIVNGKKRHYANHRSESGVTVLNQGPDPWPLFFEEEALEHGKGQWISEAEGEKCAAWLRAGKLVAVSQPGHDHTPDSIKARYARLKTAGILGIAYLADADSTGTSKAKKCASSAHEAGLLFRTIRAQDVWPSDMVAGGSIDDALGTAAERAAKFESYFIAMGPEKPSGAAEGREKPSMGYRDLLNAMLDALIKGDDDNLMEMRADAITRFRRTDTQVEAALFDLHRQRQLPGKISQQPESLDLSRISGMDWLIEGFVPDNDMTLIWGDAGSGKTTAALGAASAVLLGTGLLDYSQPAPKRHVLFIASDSGAPPLYAAMQDMGLVDLPEVKQGRDQRFFVWAADANQGMTAWAADLRGCIRLLEFVKRNRIGLVIIDSCKAVCTPSSGLDYTSNQMVTALLTYFKEVICPHTAVVWLNHDGTAAGAHAGAKAWKEIPSMVHRIRREEKKDGAKVNNRRRWDVTKSRMGPTREFFYQLSNGTLEICADQEVVGNCLAQVVDALTKAWHGQGKESLSKSELSGLICVAGGPSTKTLDNTLCSATRARNPEICKVSGKRGHYKLAPRVASALKGCMGNGKEQGEKPVSDNDLGTSRHFPAGNSAASGPEPVKFPGEIAGNSSDPRRGEGSESFPSLLPLTPHLATGEISPPMGSGADAFDAEDDPAWGPRP